MLSHCLSADRAETIASSRQPVTSYPLALLRASKSLRQAVLRLWKEDEDHKKATQQSKRDLMQTDKSGEFYASLALPTKPPNGDERNNVGLDGDDPTLHEEEDNYELRSLGQHGQVFGTHQSFSELSGDNQSLSFITPISGRSAVLRLSESEIQAPMHSERSETIPETIPETNPMSQSDMDSTSALDSLDENQFSPAEELLVEDTRLVVNDDSAGTQTVAPIEMQSAESKANQNSGEDSRSQYSKNLKMLVSGECFRKFGRRGRPKERFVWLDYSRSCIRWTDATQKQISWAKSLSGTQHIRQSRSSTKRQREMQRVLFLADIKQVQIGKECTVAAFKNRQAPAFQSCCFSLIGRMRCLHLEATSPEMCELWANSFAEIAREHSQSRSNML